LFRDVVRRQASQQLIVVAETGGEGRGIQMQFIRET
jgi:hypothetical protein